MAKDNHDQDEATETEAELDNQQTDKVDASESSEPDFQSQLETEKKAKLQIMADFQNYRRRTEEEKAKYGIMANMLLTGTILEMLDDIHLALKDKDMTLERAQEFINIMQDKLAGAVSTTGIEKINVNVGDKFDNLMMEAITTVPVEDKAQDNKVIDVISAAYKYRDQGDIFKAAKVIVGKAKA